MECELCDETFTTDEQVIPKVLKSCPHTFCQKCLLDIKEKVGKIQCPICKNNASSTIDMKFEVESLPRNESLLKALEFKEAEEQALQII